MNNELKVSFYLKRESRLEKISAGENVTYPIIGKIIIGNSIAQFSTKLKVEERLWHVKSGRATGKSRVAVELNRKINKINLLIHSHYKDILERTGTVTALNVKNAFQGIATVQKTLLVLFEEMMQEFQTRVGIDRSPCTYGGYQQSYKRLKCFIREKYKVDDIPFTQLDLPFIEAFDFYLRVERGLKPATMVTNVIYLQKAARIALHRNLISRPPFTGYKPEKPELQIRSLTKDELERLVSTPLPKSGLCYIRNLFVFSFAYAGADTFDGLEWCQTCIDENTFQVYHFQLRELFDYEIGTVKNYEIATLFKNIKAYQNINKLIQTAFDNNDMINLMDKYIPNEVIKKLIT